LLTGRVDLAQTVWRVDRQTFAERLRQQRQDTLRFTQGEMAAHLGLNQSTISRIEAGARPRDKATALAVATAYRLTRVETHEWLELLFGGADAPLGDDAGNGEWLARAYAVLERAGVEPDLAAYHYFEPIAPAAGRWLGLGFDAELTAVIDQVLANSHLLPRSHLLLELAATFSHYLNEHGHYRRRLALALAAADAAREVECRTVEGWLRSDAIPWTLLTQRPNPAEASRQLARGLALAEELHHADMQAIGLAFLAWALAMQWKMTAANETIAHALAVVCAPAARLRVLWVAGDLAASDESNEGQERAIGYYRLAEETDLAVGHGHHTTVTATLRLSAAYARRREPDAARAVLSTLLADRQAPLSPPRLARIYFDLARLSRMEGDGAMAQTYARQAAAALQQGEKDLRFGQQIRAFLAELSRA